MLLLLLLMMMMMMLMMMMVVVSGCANGSWPDLVTKNKNTVDRARLLALSFLLFLRLRLLLRWFLLLEGTNPNYDDGGGGG